MSIKLISSLYPALAKECNAWKSKVIQKHYPTELLIVTGPSGCGKTSFLTELLSDSQIKLIKFDFESKAQIQETWANAKHGATPRVLWIDEVEAFTKGDFAWLSKIDSVMSAWPGFQSARYIVLSGTTDTYSIKQKLKFPSKMIDTIKIKELRFFTPSLSGACNLVGVPNDAVSKEAWEVNPGDLRRLSNRNSHRSDDNFKAMGSFNVFPTFASAVCRKKWDEPDEFSNVSRNVPEDFKSYRVQNLGEEDSGYDKSSYQKILAIAYHDLLFPFIYHNLPNVVDAVHSTKQALCKSNRIRYDATMPTKELSDICDLFSMSDVIDQSIHRDGLFDLMDYQPFVQCINPTFIAGWADAGQKTNGFPSAYLKMHGEHQRQSKMVSEFSVHHSIKNAEACTSHQLAPIFPSEQSFVLDVEPFVRIIVENATSEVDKDALKGKNAESLGILNKVLSDMHISPGGFERMVSWSNLVEKYKSKDDASKILAQPIDKKVKDCIVSNLAPSAVDKNPKNLVIKEFLGAPKKAPPKAGKKGMQTVGPSPKKGAAGHKRKAETENKFANKRQKTDGQTKLTFGPVKVTKVVAPPLPSVPSKVRIPKIEAIFQTTPMPAPVAAPSLTAPVPVVLSPSKSGSFDKKKLSQLFKQADLQSIVHPSRGGKKKK